MCVCVFHVFSLPNRLVLNLYTFFSYFIKKLKIPYEIFILMLNYTISAYITSSNFLLILKQSDQTSNSVPTLNDNTVLFTFICTAYF